MTDIVPGDVVVCIKTPENGPTFCFEVPDPMPQKGKMYRVTGMRPGYYNPRRIMLKLREADQRYSYRSDHFRKLGRGEDLSELQKQRELEDA